MPQGIQWQRVPGQLIANPKSAFTWGSGTDGPQTCPKWKYMGQSTLQHCLSQRKSAVEVEL